MTSLSAQILQAFQVRKTKKQKLAFISLLRERFPCLQVEEGGFGHNRNLILGDPASAKVLLTAHYDTCALLPFPNFIMPRNIPATIGYNLLICIPFFAFLLGVQQLLNLWLDSYRLGWFLAYIAMMGLLFFVLLGGRPNPHTANDNTSGVITVLEIYQAMSAAQRAKAAVVLFDNEENGLLGSSWFAGRHKNEKLTEKLVLNFDCVSDGSYLLFVQNKPARTQYGKALSAAFPETPEKKPVFAKSSNTMYPSDQTNFPVNVAIAAMQKGFPGLYTDKIHTKRDTVFMESNIDYLLRGTLRFLTHILTP